LERVGEVSKTDLPLPVSSVNAVAKSELEKLLKLVLIDVAPLPLIAPDKVIDWFPVK